MWEVDVKSIPYLNEQKLLVLKAKAIVKSNEKEESAKIIKLDKIGQK